MLQYRTAIPAVWVYSTQGAYNAMGAGGYGAFLTPDQQARAERLRQARLLYQGGDGHRKYFLEEARTQFDFPAVRVGSRLIQMYLAFNVLKLISKKSADLLFGQEPLLRVDDEIQQAKLSDLAERTSLHQRLYSAAVECSYEGESFLEACAQRGQVYVRRIPADTIFPLGQVGPDGQYERYLAFALQNVGTQQSPVNLLLETTYAPGSIERHLWQLDADGRRRVEVDLKNWPLPAGVEPLAPLTRTGIALNTVTWVPNETFQDQAVSDYDGLIDLQDELNAKQTQIGRVLAKHSDPKLAMPADAVDEMGNVRSDHDVFFFRSKEEIPGYIVWNAELEQARLDRSFTLNALCITAETSPVLLGLKEGAAPDAYRKLRLEAQNSLTKAQRKATAWKPAIRRLLGIAQDLEQTMPGTRYDRYPVGVEMRDGLGVDDLDQANTIATLRGAGVMSVERALEQQLTDPAAVRKELASLVEEEKAKLPAVMMGSGRTAANAAGAEPGEEAGAAVGTDAADAGSQISDLRSETGVAA